MPCISASDFSLCNTDSGSSPKCLGLPWVRLPHVQLFHAAHCTHQRETQTGREQVLMSGSAPRLVRRAWAFRCARFFPGLLFTYSFNRPEILSCRISRHNFNYFWYLGNQLFLWPHHLISSYVECRHSATQSGNLSHDEIEPLIHGHRAWRLALNSRGEKLPWF